MRTLIGPMVCKGCRAHVWGVDLRTVELPCDGGCLQHMAPIDRAFRCECHTHPVPDVGPFTVVDAEGERHQCVA